MFKKISQGFSHVRTLMSHDQGIMILIMMIIVVGPFVFWPLHNFPSTLIKGIFVSLAAVVGLIAYAIHALRAGGLSFAKHPVLISMLGTAVAGLIGAFLSGSFAHAVLGYAIGPTTVVFTVALTACAWFAYRMVRNHARAALVYGGIFFAGLLLVIMHMVRFFGGTNILSFGVLGNATSSLLGTWADLGFIVGLLVIICVATIELAGLRKSVNIFLGIAGFLGLVALVFMNIRMVWVILGLVSLLMSLYVFSLAYWNSDDQEYRRDRRVPWLAIVVFFVSLVCMVAGSWFGSFANRYQNISYSEVRLTSAMTARTAWASIIHNPVTGYGPNNFTIAWNHAKPPAFSGTQYGSVDFQSGFGFIPTQLATGGISGIIAWLAFSVMIIWMLGKMLVMPTTSHTDRYFHAITFAAVAYLFIASWVANPGVCLLAIFALVLGMAAWMVPMGKPETTWSFINDPRASFFGILGILASIIVLVVAGYWMIRMTASLLHYYRGLSATNEQTIGVEWERAASLAGFDWYHRQLSSYGLAKIGSLDTATASKEALSKQIEQLIGTALGHAQAAINYQDASYRNYITLGNVYRTMTELNVAGAYDKAFGAYQEAAKRNPQDPTMDLNYARLALAAKKTDQALKFINQSIDRYPTSSAYVLRAQIEATQGRNDAVITSLRAAVAVDPRNATVQYQYGLALFTQRDYSAAVIAFQNVVVLAPQFGPGYVYLGVSYERAGNIGQANQVYDFLRKRFTDADTAIANAKKGGEAPALETADTTTGELPNSTDSKKPVATPPKKQ